MPYETLGGEILVNSSTSGDQLLPEVTALTGGGYVICWTDIDTSGDGWGTSVKAQLIGPDGTPIGGELLINSTTSADQKIASVDALDNGGFAITWADSSNLTGDSNGSGVIVRLYGPDGTPSTGEILVNTTTTNDQVEPYVAALSGGGFVVTWIDYSNEGGDDSVSAVRAQVFDSDGSPVGGEILVNTETHHYQIQPQISGLANGNFVITWTDRSGAGGDSSNFGVKAQLFSADGTKIGGEFLVNTETANEQADPTVTGLVGGGFVITWNDHSGLGGDSSGWGIRAQVYDVNGSPLGGEFVVNSVTFDEQQGPSVAALPDGGFVISWMDYAGTFGGAGGGIKAQIFAADGTPSGTEFLVNSIDDFRQLNPDVAAQADGSFLVTWSSNGLGGDGSGYGIKAQLYVPDTGAPENQAPSVPDSPSVATDEQVAVTINAALTVSDADLDARNGGAGDYAGASFTISRAVASLDDLFSFAVAGAGFQVTGSDLEAGGMVFGTIAQSAGSLTITFNSSETVATTALVNDVLQHLQYTNTSDLPPASVTLVYTLDDGAPGGGQGTVVDGNNVDDGEIIVTINNTVDPLVGDGTDNSITGTPEADVFLVQQGGIDTVSGLASGDTFYFGGALTADDVVDGGADYDTLMLQGDYSGGLALTSNITGIEAISLLSGSNTAFGDTANNFYDYSITIDDANFDSSLGVVSINGGSLRIGEDWTFDGSAETDASLLVYGGSGVDDLTGGGMNDIFVFGHFGQFGAGDTVDGGAGYDGLVLRGDYTVDFSGPWFADALQGIENVTLMSSSDERYGGGGDGEFDYALTWDDDLLGAGQTIDIDGALLQAAETMSFDGSGETDGHFQISGGAGSDLLIGGSGNDLLLGGAGDDQLVGGEGNDQLIGGWDDAPGGNDTLTGGGGVDTFALRTFDNSVTITDFVSGEDIFYLSVYMDSNPNEPGLQTWYYVTGAYRSDLTDKGQIVLTGSGSDYTLSIYQAGDAIADTIVQSNAAILLSDMPYYVEAAPDAPSGDAQDDAFTTDELNSVTGNLFDDNGNGADTDPVAIAAVNGDSGNVGSQITLPSGALLTVNSDGSFAYDPNGAFQYTPTFASGAFNTPSADSFSYTLEGGDTATVILTINGVNNDDTVIGSEDGNRLISGIGNDLVFGLGGNDYITGGFGDDMIFGDDGIDRAGWYQVNEALGGTTVSLLLQGQAQDTGSQGWDTLFDIENLSGTPFADSLTGDDNDNWLWGSPSTIAVDWISASNNDFLDGQGGNDLLTVGIGNHTIIGGDGNDTLSFTENGAAEPGITVALWENLAQDTGAGTWTLSGVENLFGGIGDDSLEGDDGENIIGGSTGSDLLFGYGSNDTLYGDGFVTTINNVPTTFVDSDIEGGNDQLFGGGGDDILYGGAGNDSLRGNAGNDAHYGGIGDDLIVGGSGDDVIDGGDGYDRAGNYHLNEILGGVTIDLNIVGAQDTGSQGWDTLVGIEYVSGTPWADTLTGDGNDNVLWGSIAMIDPGTNWVSTSNNDTLDGGAGNDLLYAGIGNHSLAGGDGIDTVGFTENWGDDPAISISLALQGAAQDTGQGLWTLTGIENLSGGDDNDQLTGDGTANILAGYAGGDLLSGGGGDDSLYGDGVIDSGSPSSGPPTLFTDVGANGDDVLDGGEGNDQLYGGGGNDQLTGGAGDDLLDGGAGRDLANYGPEAGPVTVDLGAGTATGPGGNDTLVGIEDVLGTGGDDLLIGDGDYNVLNGGGGNDTIDGAGGDDTLMGDIGSDELYGNTGNDQLIGGLGDDVLDGGDGGGDVADYQYAAGGVTALLYGGGSGETFGADGHDQLSNIEALNGSAFNDILYADEGHDLVVGNGGHDDVRGGDGDDSIFAGDGDDLLYGNGGDDLLDGGAGYDRVGYFSGATAGVTVDLNLQGIAQDTGQGMDVLVNIENVSGTRFGDTLTGDGGDNVLWGSAATLGSDVSTENNDTLSGGGGNDLLIAGIGNHVIDGGDGIDTFRFTENGVPETGITLSLLLAGQAQASGNGSWTLTGIENLSGGIGGDNLTGDGNANVLAGDLGDDLLSGGAGDDTLYGDGQIMWDDHGTGRSGPAITTADATSEYVGGVSGNDTLEGGLGDDVIDGGGGSDTASYANAAGGVVAFLYRLGNGNGESDGADGADLLFNIENLTGSAFADQMAGNNLANVIAGGDGNDGLRGYAGDDTLLGGGGNDFLNGGLGNDIVDGGDGYDRAAFYEDAGPSGVTVDLNITGAQDTGQGMDTLIGIENVSGSIYGDTLTGDDGDNQLWGSASTLTNGTIVTTNNDILSGNGGNDLLVVGIGNHTVDGGTGIDTFRFTENGAPETGITLSLLLQGAVQASGNGSWTLTNIENLSGGVADDTLTGDGIANVLAGDRGDDTLNGGGGDDILYGDGAINVDGFGSGPITTYQDVVATFGGVSGDDILEGGDGNDQLYGGGGSDTASYGSASGGIVAVLNDDGSGFGFGAAGFDQLHDIENLAGSAFNDTLAGNAEANILSGGGGADIIVGRAGSDILNGGDGDDYLRGDDNTASDDILNGGDGWDRAVYNLAPNGVTIDLNIQGVAQDTGLGMDTLISIEHASGSTFNDTITGDGGDNWLRSWGGDDVLSGNGGNDLIETMPGNNVVDGGSGIDTWSFYGDGTFFSSGVNVSLALQGTAQDTGQGTMLATGFENLSGSIHADTLAGDGAANVIAGDAGSDTLSGGAGDDVLYGDGSIFVDWHGDGGSGPITHFTDITPILGGVAGDDTLEGGLGNDTLDGGGGVDTASYANATGGVTVNLNGGFASGADGNDTLVNMENVTGSGFNDNLTGNGGTNVIDGLGGNDTISGHAGDDAIYGGDGDDFLQGDLSENNITVTGNDVLYGGNGNDLLRGGLGDDQLYGGANNDNLRGNGGVDSFDGGADDGVGFNGIGDRVSFFEQRATQGVVADLRTGVISNDGFGNVETMVGIESLGADTAFVDTFHGDDGRNYLAGNRGDNLYGYGSDDFFQMTSAAAVIDGGAGTDLLSVLVGAGWLTPDANADGLAEIAAAATAGWTVNLAAGTSADGYGNTGTVTGIENVDGSILGDVLIGDGNSNVLNGFDGNDRLEGGLGNDTLDGGNGTDTATYANASGGVTVNLFSATATGADGSDTLANIENLVGSAFADTLVGNGVANVLDGGSGLDTLAGFGGNDTLNGDAGDDNLFGHQGNDTLNGGDGNDNLFGGTGNDMIDGSAGFNLAGYSPSPFDPLAGGVTVDLNLQGIAQDTGQGVDTLVNIQGLNGTQFNDTLIGDGNTNLLIAAGGTVGAAGGDDQLFGNGGDDLLIVGSGNVLLDGGTGNDTANFGAAGATLLNGVTVSLALQGAAQATGSGSMTLTGIENLSGTGLADTLTGDGSDNALSGSGGDDLLVGGAGNDSLRGDAAFTAFSPTDSSLMAPYLAPDASVFAGQVVGNDTLEGGLGNDLLEGGGGIDTASYANASGAVTVNLGTGTSSGADGNDTLAGIENVTGGAFNDVLTGSGSDNVLAGGDGHDSLSGGDGNDTLQAGSGNDSLTGGTGDDVLDGGAGFDRANYNVGATAGVTVNLSLAGAQNTGQGMDTLTGVEHVVGTVFNDVLTGDAGDNWLWGGSLGTGVTGNDIISGGDGNDLIEVGTGNHTLSGGNGTSDTLSFWAGGTDVTSTGVSFNLGTTTAQNTRQGTTTGTGFENVSGSRYGDILTGDTQNNILAGHTGNDTLNGGIGSDTLYGDGGYTTFTAGGLATGPIRLVGDITTEFGGVAGNDTLNGGDGDDFLYGGGGSDTLKGDKENDTLYGGTGNDTLVGGQGNDLYVIEANSGADTISGFAHLVDNIYFDASSGVSSFSQLTLTRVGGTNTLVTWGNGNSIMIQGLKPTDLSAADFSFATAAAATAAKEIPPTMRVYPTDSFDASSQDAATNWYAPVPDYLMG